MFISVGLVVVKKNEEEHKRVFYLLLARAIIGITACTSSGEIFSFLLTVVSESSIIVFGEILRL